MRKIDFLQPAEEEFLEGVEYYNHQRKGLGFEFAVEVKRTLERIVRYPKAWAPLSERTRRCRTNRFPYGVIYQLRRESVLIVAIMDLRRDPKTWKSRLGSS